MAIEVLGDETEGERRAEREIGRLEGIDCGGSNINEEGAGVSEETLEPSPEAVEGLDIKQAVSSEKDTTGMIHAK